MMESARGLGYTNVGFSRKGSFGLRWALGMGRAIVGVAYDPQIAPVPKDFGRRERQDPLRTQSRMMVRCLAGRLQGGIGCLLVVHMAISRGTA